MSDATAPRSPYKGLAPFEEADAPLFFGRERERRVIAANLLAARLTVLYAASGVGKSSVLAAGVVPYVRAEARENLADSGLPELAIVQFSAWSVPDPATALAARIAEAVAAQVGATIATAEQSLLDVVQAASAAVDGPVLLILDQFEEYFRYHGQAADDPFAAQFPALVIRPGVRAHVLVALREDELTVLDRFKGRIPNLFGNYYRLHHLDRVAARSAIEGPLHEFQRQGGAGPGAIEEPLVETLLDQLRTTQPRPIVPGAPTVERGIETPYLQLVLDRLWHEEARLGSAMLRLATLQRLGGAGHIVRDHVRAALATLSAREQAIAARAFRYLVTPSGVKYAWSVADLAHAADIPQAQLQPVISRLSDPGVRILRPVAAQPGAGNEPRVEIFHDVLAQEVREWRQQFVQARERRRIIGIAVASVIAFMLLLGALAAPTLYRQYLRMEATRLNPMIALAGGTATLGAPDADLATGERPLRQVQLAPFAIQQYEVTNAEYGLCLRASACRVWGPDQERAMTTAAPRLPVVGVNAFQADEYCRWIGGALPSDDQWERAARGLDGRAWPWGAAPPTRERANVATFEEQDPPIAPVGSFPAGKSLDGAGVYDLVGNAQEWTSTQFPCKDADCPWSPMIAAIDPADPLRTNGLYLRGGHWRSAAQRITDPLISIPAFAEPEFGFRCVSK